MHMNHINYIPPKTEQIKLNLSLFHLTKLLFSLKTISHCNIKYVFFLQKNDLYAHYKHRNRFSR